MSGHGEHGGDHGHSGGGGGWFSKFVKENAEYINPFKHVATAMKEAVSKENLIKVLDMMKPFVLGLGEGLAAIIPGTSLAGGGGGGHGHGGGHSDHGHGDHGHSGGH